MTDTRTTIEDVAGALGAIAALAAVAAVAVLFFAPAVTVGDPSSVEAQLRSPTWQPAVATIEPLTDTDHDGGGSPVANTVQLLEELANPSPALPVRLRVDALGVDAPIDPYGVDASGEMDVPANVSDVGWYRFGPVPGERGSAVLAAHVDLAGQGPGVFFGLHSIEPGDRLMITFSDGSEQWFVTTARTTYEKEDLPLDAIFSRAGNPVLTLITCGGGFNRTIQRYDSNVVVYAVPIASASRTRTPD